jgi:iron complex outermembrane receptor protein
MAGGARAGEALNYFRPFIGSKWLSGGEIEPFILFTSPKPGPPDSVHATNVRISVEILMLLRTRFRVGVILLATLAITASLSAQTGVTLSGRLVDSLTAQPVNDVVVQLDELRRQVVSAADGTFTFDNVPAGVYHLSVRSPRYSSRRTEITVGASAAPPVEIAVDPELHFEEVVSVSPEARSQFEAYQPTSVLAGQELGKQLEMSIGDTLQQEPGVAVRSFGPATTRPVVRGLDGDRVLILQDGQRTGDLSMQSADHAVTVNPAAAQRIEVVRGPATLLYGSNAIGGLVNVITDQIVMAPLQGTSGSATFDVGTAAKDVGAAADVRVGNGKAAFVAGGGGRRSDDVNTPEGEILNSQSRSGFGSVGVSWTGEKGYFGGSYGYDDTKLGLPVVEEGILQSTPRKHSIGVRAGASNLTGAFEGFRATATIRRYKHEELAGEEIGTAFKNDTNEVELVGNHQAIGRLKGSIGGWVLDRAFDAVGAEALSPAVTQRGFAAFLYEEVTWPHATFQFGGRFDRTNYEPLDEDKRDFTTGSGSVGLLLRPAAADDRVTIAISAARAARYPALEELFYFGPHPGNFRFEIGNPDLSPEYAFGFDMSLRWRGARASGEVTYFRNDISNFVFTAPLTPEEFEERESEFAERFPGRGIGEHEEGGEHHEEEFPIIEYVGADSLLQGLEAHADFAVTPTVIVEVGADYVQGTVTETDEPLPRMPPLRFRGGLRYQSDSFQAGGEVTAVSKQDRVFSTETPTDGYQLLRLFTSYTFAGGESAHTITARLDNATNELYRSHLSLIKDLVPEMGRNFKVVYNVKF